MQRSRQLRQLGIFSLTRSTTCQLPGLLARICDSHSLKRQFVRYASSSLKSLNADPARLSSIWIPTGGIAANDEEDSHDMLIRAGFLRQAHSGIFHMLPLGQRVQDKIEALIDKHMAKLGASRLALSSISSEELWARSGRLNSSSELFRLEDRKQVKYLLAPTHEEEITELVAKTVNSYKQLPVRLYQIGRKYRDELRPRHGLLRSREFVMKDLYTFDWSGSLAMDTYEDVRIAYSKIFDELKIPYMVAEADSGDIGGDLSHEYHFPTSKGEDHIIKCGSSNCEYVANEELATTGPRQIIDSIDIETQVFCHRSISKDRNTLINVWSWTPREISESGSLEFNTRAIKSNVPEFDPSVEGTINRGMKEDDHKVLPTESNKVPTSKVINLIDKEMPRDALDMIYALSEKNKEQILHTDSSTAGLQRIQDGDVCPKCLSSSLQVHKAIELGHTFHLGTRYSKPMGAIINAPSSLLNNPKHKLDSKHYQMTNAPMEMGCHGIGVTRMIGAVAETLADSSGLNWPRVIAPFEVVVIANEKLDRAAVKVHDELDNMDVVIDDRLKTLPWKLQDADLIGYPVILVLGRDWVEKEEVEIQCRRLNLRWSTPLCNLKSTVHAILDRL